MTRPRERWRGWPARTRFHTWLAAMSGAGLLALASTVALVSGEFLNRRLDRLALDLLGELTGQLADRSRLVFLGSPELAGAHVAEIAAFPGVSNAAILKPSAETWVASSRAGCGLPPLAGSAGQSRPERVEEDRLCWYFVAPVRLETDASPLTAPRESRLLGYLAVAWRKEPLRQVQSGLLALNGAVALILALGIGVGIQYVLRRLTEPLDRLARVIQRLRAGETGARTPVAGPAETREIGRAFNALLDDIERHRAALERHRAQLERQRRELESLVEMRTQDLRAARDAALTAARYKSEFMAAITHEMRTPLQSVIGYAREGQKALVFLEEDADPVVLDHLARSLDIVRGAAGDLLARIDQVLDLAALEAGKRDLRLETVDLPALLDEVVALLKPLIERNGNRVEARFEGLRQVILDRDKTRQIVRNLLDNACKFTREGLVLLEVTCTRDELVIEVADCGIGIPADQLDLVFEPFRQADMSDSRRHGGTGLGLAITRSLCHLMGGTIVADSAPGVGTLFRAVIPLPVLQAG